MSHLSWPLKISSLKIGDWSTQILWQASPSIGKLKSVANLSVLAPFASCKLQLTSEKSQLWYINYSFLCPDFTRFLFKSVPLPEAVHIQHHCRIIESQEFLSKGSYHLKTTSCREQLSRLCLIIHSTPDSDDYVILMWNLISPALMCLSTCFICFHAFWRQKLLFLRFYWVNAGFIFLSSIILFWE